MQPGAIGDGVAQEERCCSLAAVVVRASHRHAIGPSRAMPGIGAPGIPPQGEAPAGQGATPVALPCLACRSQCILHRLILMS